MTDDAAAAPRGFADVHEYVKVLEGIAGYECPKCLGRVTIIEDKGECERCKTLYQRRKPRLRPLPGDFEEVSC